MKSILFATGYFYPDVSGGPNLSIYWLSKSLFRHSIKVSVLTTDMGIDKKIPRNTWLKTDYGDAQYVKTWKNKFPVTLLFKCIKILPHHNTLYLGSFFHPISFLLAPIAIILGKQVIWAPRGETSPSALKFGFFKKKFVLWIIKLIKSKVLFHATSDAETVDIQNIIGKCHICQIPIGIEIPEQIIVTPNAQINIIFIGRIHPIKGIEYLIKALAKSKKFIKSNHKLLIAGYAQRDYDKLLIKIIEENRLSSKIKFIGRIEGKEKNLFIARAYCLILPSLSENFGVVVAEALSQGTPCIASLGTPWSILETNKAGYHVSNEPQTLAHAIDKLLSLETEEYIEMRKSARNLIENEFNIEKTIGKWINLLQ